ncbi:PTS fructose transporter subunit IIA [Sulfuriflexus sp.]|uniref:PTS sugar transporter subunit IIA n=1 Tax=Sulfuriflexus sp. TaxID=2015443 RepID=UPI0028CE65BE|nr:PTS fructose transporter subunit IIA [Sulfuriflexus sp.]MDT8403481.1 PTS fructose transporter subunit IIA [Sulfuriflexus sp.]
MSVSLLLITHDNIGTALMDTATAMLGVSPMQVDIIAVRRGNNPDDVVAEAERIIHDHEQTLVLTDMYGSTPSNIACRLHTQASVRVVGGINLPMLIRVLNYPRLSLDELVDKAISGGRDGVLSCKTEQDE